MDSVSRGKGNLICTLKDKLLNIKEVAFQVGWRGSQERNGDKNEESAL